MPGLLLAAVRDLDPPAGGAEMSLATLLKGVSEPGPLSEHAPNYTPCTTSPDIDPAVLRPAWRISTFQSSARGEITSLTKESVLKRRAYELDIEDVWSGAAWRLRKKSGQPNNKLQYRHLRKVNEKFAKTIEADLSDVVRRTRGTGLPLGGVTQLHWSAGAAELFSKYEIPYLVFVRDELQFMYPDLYRTSLENATAVCCAGQGLGAQVAAEFDVNAIRNVPLPVDFGGRFGNWEAINAARAAVLEDRAKSGDIHTPRIAIVGVTPEKGFEFYQQLLPHMARVWPEARIDVYGGGAYAEKLGKFDNVTWRGHTSVDQVFSGCDIHLLTVASTGSWGRVINEAGLFGVPTVTVDIGSQPEAVGAGGLVVSKDAKLDDWVDSLRATYEGRVVLGQRAREHCGIVDHRSSIAAFRSVLHEFVG